VPGVPTAEHDLVHHECGGDGVHDIQHAPPPAAFAEPEERALADLVLELALPVGQAGQLHRDEDPIHHERRAEPGTEPEEEHRPALVAAQRLHPRIIHDPDWLPDGPGEVEPRPARAQVRRFAHHLAADHGCGNADAHRVELPAPRGHGPPDGRQHAAPDRRGS
jgi:hypothetical protein